MIWKLAAGIFLHVILLRWIDNLRSNADFPHEKIVRLLINGIFAALAATLVGLVMGISGHLKGWRPAGTLITIAFSAWIMKGLTEQIARYVALRLNKDSVEFLTWYDAVFFGAVIGTGFGIGKGFAELFEEGNVMIGVIRELVPVHFAAGAWTGYLFGRGVRTQKGYYGAAAILLPALVQGLYEFCVSYQMLERGLWFVCVLGILMMAGVLAFTVLCLKRWKKIPAMKELLP